MFYLFKIHEPFFSTLPILNLTFSRTIKFLRCVLDSEEFKSNTTEV